MIRVPERDALRAAPRCARHRHRDLLSGTVPPAGVLRRPGLQDRRLPGAEAAAARSLALPIYPELTEAQQARVVEAIATFYKRLSLRAGSGRRELRPAGDGGVVAGTEQQRVEVVGVAVGGVVDRVEARVIRRFDERPYRRSRASLPSAG